MLVNELRVGNLIGQNLVDFPDNFFRVIEVAETNMKVTDSWLCDPKDYFKKRVETSFFSCEIMEGIPLTNWWFNNLGFNHENTIGGWSKWSNEHLSILDMKLHYACNEPLPINYVHQLQNLYYALAGKELIYGLTFKS